MTFDVFGSDEQAPVQQVDPEVERLKKEERDRLAIKEEKDKEKKAAIIAGMRGQRSLMSPNQYKGYRNTLGSN